LALSYQCDCFCDRCGNWQAGAVQYGTANGLGRLALEIAKKEGWKRQRKEDGAYEDVCPQCLEKEFFND
jgi:hypothetical protein